MAAYFTVIFPNEPKPARDEQLVRVMRAIQGIIPFYSEGEADRLIERLEKQMKRDMRLKRRLLRESSRMSCPSPAACLFFFAIIALSNLPYVRAMHPPPLDQTAGNGNQRGTVRPREPDGNDDRGYQRPRPNDNPRQYTEMITLARRDDASSSALRSCNFPFPTQFLIEMQEI